MRALTQADREKLTEPLFFERYRRASSHDQQSTGIFVTGIPRSETFCCPGCSTRTPRPSQVTFYPTAAAAHRAGLHPCPRCRPDAAPGPPDLMTDDSLAARALRLITDGEVERHGIAGVAQRLNVTPRHLRRVVEARAGCGPLTVARAARAHLARLLLTSINVPLSTIAAATGLTSVRQLSSTLAEHYGATPGQLRSASQPRSGTTLDSEPLVLHCSLPLRQPYDAPGTFRALLEHAVPGVEHGGEHWYARTVRLPHSAGHLRVDADSRGGLLATLSVLDPRDLRPLQARVRRLLDLDADPVRTDRMLARDPVFAPLVAACPGVRIPGCVDIKEALLRAVAGQGLSGSSTRTVLGALTRELGEATPWGLLFPSPARIATRGRDVLRGPREHVDAIVTLAADLASGRLDVHLGWTREQLYDALSPRPGITAATVQQAVGQALGHTDTDAPFAWDEQVRRGAARLRLPADIDGLQTHALRWSPLRHYAAERLRRAVAGA